MESVYGIETSNRFLLDFDNVEDPADLIITKPEKKPKTSKPKKPETPSQKKNSEKEPDVKSRKEVDTKESRPDSKRGGSRGGRGNTDNRPPRRSREGGSDRRRQDYTESVEDQENQAPKEYRSERTERPPRNRDFGDRPPRDLGDRPPRDFGDRPTREFGGDRPPRGRGGRGRGGRGRGGAGRDFRGKREFDRHSGSDKSSSFKPQEKREGGGTHNWGNFKDDISRDTVTESPANTSATEEWGATEEGEIKATDTPVENSESKPDNAAPGDGEAEEQEPVVQEMTLDEYKAMQAEQRYKNAFNLRRAGEGEDSKQWKKTFQLKKEAAAAAAAAAEAGEPKAEVIVEAPDALSKDKHGHKETVGIDIQFYDQPTRGGRGGRRGGPGGGRGRGRGRGGGGGRGGGSRGGRSHDETQLSLADDKEFPSL